MAEQPSVPRRDALDALRNPYVRAFAFGKIASYMGAQIISVAVGWELYERTNDPWALGLVGLFEILPVVVLMLPAGNAADRFARRNVGIIAYGLLSLAALGLTDSTALVLPEVLAWAPYAGLHGRRSWSQHLFAGVVLVDRRGWVLLQERDEHPRIDPDKWGLAGGHLDPGEDFETGAYRELEEETGVRLAPGTLELWGEFVVDHREPYGTFDRMRVFVAATDLTDDDIECQEGRRIVFVDPEQARGLDLTSAAAEIVPTFLDSDSHRRLVDRARQETP